MANGGNSEGLFHAAIGDSSPTIFFPLSDGSYTTSIYQQFAGFVYVSFHRLEASHFLISDMTEGVLTGVQIRSSAFVQPLLKH